VVLSRAAIGAYDGADALFSTSTRSTMRSGHLPSPPEPGLLRVFKLFMAAQLLLLGSWVAWRWLQSHQATVSYQWLALVVPAAVLVHFAWPGLARRLGAAHLPIALLIASAGPLIAYAIMVRLRVAAGELPDTLLRDAWLLIVALLLPCILVAWQYGLRAVLWFCSLTALLDLLLLLPQAAAGGPAPATVIGVALVRILFFLPVGYAVARLVSALREQRDALASARERLARHAATVEQLSVSRERNRLARELHDTLAHTLSSLVVQLEAVSVLWSADTPRAHALLADALANTRHGLHESRRAIQALRATPLEALGLVGALREAAQSAAERGGLQLSLQLPTTLDLADDEAEQAVYRIAEEALTNVVRHAQARHLHLRLDTAPLLTLTVSDDGCGFDPQGVDETHHHGLRGVHERAQLAGARVVVRSAAGAGTTVELVLQGGAR